MPSLIYIPRDLFGLLPDVRDDCRGTIPDLATGKFIDDAGTGILSNSWSPVPALHSLQIPPQHRKDALIQEKKYSTAYVLLEILMQTFLCNMCLVALGYPLILLGVGNKFTYMGYGMYPALFVFIWQSVSEKPE